MPRTTHPDPDNVPSFSLPAPLKPLKPKKPNNTSGTSSMSSFHLPPPLHNGGSSNASSSPNNDVAATSTGRTMLQRTHPDPNDAPSFSLPGPVRPLKPKKTSATSSMSSFHLPNALHDSGTGYAFPSSMGKTQKTHRRVTSR